MMDRAMPTPEDRAEFLARLDEALPHAHIPSLIAATIHLTGDAALMLSSPRPEYGQFEDLQGQLPQAVQDQALAQARAALLAYLDGAATPPPPSGDLLRKMMDFVAGAELPERYVPLLLEQLALHGADPRRPDWSSPPLKRVAQAKHVVIVGAGMSGLLVALRLQQAGIRYEIIEKNADVGGTWLENLYPGCRVDTPNHLYSFSFESNHEWPSYFSKQGVLLEYFRELAGKHDLRRHIRFSTRATAMEFDQRDQRWRVTVEGADGQERVIEADFVISAVGQLNQPRMPGIPGEDSFAGPSFHSARWRHDVDLKGRRVGVIGTGASAFQFVPEIAEEAGETVIFQRSPPWLVPTYEYHDEVPSQARWLLEHVPFYERWYRFRLFWKMTEGIFEAVMADADWTGPDTAIGVRSAEVRQFLVDEIARQCEGDEELLRIVVPDYPFGSKRPLRDNGQWIRTLRRDDVQVVTSAIEAITPQGVRTADGREHDLDVLVYGTGFHASDFLRTIDVRGRDGVSLQEIWAGDARAYLGVAVPQFPNMFIMYGPNTNIAVNGSIIFLMECAANYILDCMKLATERGSATIEVREDAYEDYNAEIDEANRQRAWGVPQAQSWYKNASGRVSQNWPHRLIDFWERTRAPDPDAWRFDSEQAEVAGGKQNVA